MVHAVDCPMELVLQQLHCHERLRMLSIEATTNRGNFPIYGLDDAIVLPLSSFLSSTGTLETLELKDFKFSRDQFMPLLHAMQSCSTLVRLVLAGDMEVGAARGMANWFRQPRVSSLCELCLGDESFAHDCVTLMTSILIPLEDSPQQSSTGALLRVLELDTDIYNIQILEALASKGSQLETLSLQFLNYRTCWQIIRYLPDMMRFARIECLRSLWGLRCVQFFAGLAPERQFAGSIC
jgi:hypothetical protein